jgi:hypothetical protein
MATKTTLDFLTKLIVVATGLAGSLDACWQFNYATYKAKGINSHWIKVIQIKYPYQKWLKPIYAILGIAIVFTAVF